MTQPSEPPARLGVLPVLGALGFASLAPVGLLTLPFAIIVMLRGDRLRGPTFAGALALGISLWWLSRVGEPPDQLVRSVAVIGTAAFILIGKRTKWSLVHRSLGTVAVAAVSAGAHLLILGTTWNELRWWVETGITSSTQITLNLMAPLGSEPSGTVFGPLVFRLEDILATTVPLMADFFPATLAIQLLTGLVLATILSDRIVPVGTGRPRREFRQFRFSEHLGWIAVFALGVLLLAKLAILKLFAANLLAVAGLLYALRGASVVWFALNLAGGPGFLLTAVVALAVLILLPVVALGAILLGVVDTGIDLRQRLIAPRARS